MHTIFHAAIECRCRRGGVRRIEIERLREELHAMSPIRWIVGIAGYRIDHQLVLVGLVSF